MPTSIRARSDSFADHYSQARLFWNSQTPVVQEHIIQAYAFELSKVERRYIRKRVIQNILPNISMDLARAVGEMHGIDVPNEPPASEKEYGRGRTEKSAALSLMARLPGNIKHRKVAILAVDGVDAGEITEIKNKLIKGGATPLVITPSMAALTAANGETVESDAMLNGLPSVTMDVVIVPGGEHSIRHLCQSGQGLYYLQEAYKHLNVIAAVSQGSELVETAGLGANEEGVLTGERVGDVFGEFCEHLGRHCVWSRNDKANRVPA